MFCLVAYDIISETNTDNSGKTQHCLLICIVYYWSYSQTILNVDTKILLMFISSKYGFSVSAMKKHIDPSLVSRIYFTAVH